MNLKLLPILAVIGGLLGCQPKNSLVFLTDPRFPPYTLVHEGQFCGVDVDIARAVAKKMGRPLVIREVRINKIFSELANDGGDFAAANISITKERKSSVFFSRPYAISHVVTVSRKDVQAESFDPATQKVGVLKGTNSAKIAADYFKSEYLEYNSVSEMMKAIERLEVPCGVCDEGSAMSLIKNFKNLRIVNANLATVEYGVAVSKQNPEGPELAEIIGDVINDMEKSGALSKSVNYWRSVAK